MPYIDPRNKHRLAEMIQGTLEEFHGKRDYIFTWMKWEPITYPTGLKGWFGRVVIGASGFRTAVYDVTLERNNWRIEQRS